MSQDWIEAAGEKCHEHACDMYAMPVNREQDAQAFADIIRSHAPPVQEVNRQEWRCPHCGGYDAGGLELSCSGCGRPAVLAPTPSRQVVDIDALAVQCEKVLRLATPPMISLDAGKVLELIQRIRDLELSVSSDGVRMGLVETVRASRDRERALRELVQEVLNSGVSFSDPRIKYKEVQISVAWYEEAKAALSSQPSQPEGTQ